MRASLQFSYFTWLKSIQLFEEGSVWILGSSHLHRSKIKILSSEADLKLVLTRALFI